ncbi:MAG: amino acid ABC transporter permease, partial [Lachnospiraceae bacterium]
MDSISTQFYKAFIRNDRWLLYLKGLGNTLEVTAFAALLGVVLGTLACLFNLQRSKSGKRTIGSYIAYVYIDVIRGTPTMIQLLIMWNVIMATSKNKILVA